MPTKPDQRIAESARSLGLALDADVFIYSGALDPPLDRDFTSLVRERSERENVIVYLTTHGGSPHSAYRIARCLQSEYEQGKVSLLVNSDCKSAGTLLAIGADEIVMSDSAELGPLDVQVADKEEVWEYSSGLTLMQSLEFLQQRTIQTFLQHFQSLHTPGVGFPTKLAADIAAKHVVGLYSPIYAQLDPMRLGENQRAMFLGTQYGGRLAKGKVSKSSVEFLVAAYPAHEFVIDRSEAARIFPNVRGTTELEDELIEAAQRMVQDVDGEDAVFCAAFAEHKENADTQNGDAHHDRDQETPAHPAAAERVDEKALRVSEPKPARTAPAAATEAGQTPAAATGHHLRG